MHTLSDACASSCNKRPLTFALPILEQAKRAIMTNAPIAADNSAENFESAPLVGNPRRIRGLDRSMLERPARVSNMVGNPRRLRKLEPAAFLAA